MDVKKIKIGFLIIGTNNYLALAEECAKSIREHINIDNSTGIMYPNIDTIIFTNDIPFHRMATFGCCEHLHADNNIYKYIDHLPWPLITLMRYHYFIQNEKLLSQYDYLYYIDADMRVVAPIGKEILGERVACQHPGLYGSISRTLPLERNPISTACIPLEFTIKPLSTEYFFGALQGGSSVEFLKMSRILRDRINTDLKNNYIALWHDESQMNKYFYENPPDVILGKEYAYVDKWFKGLDLEKNKKIEALEKDHEQYRRE